MKITIKLMLLFIVIPLLLTVVISYLSLEISGDQILKKTTDQLQSVTILKENQLQEYLLEKSEDLEMIAKDPLLLNEIKHKNNHLINFKNHSSSDLFIKDYLSNNLNHQDDFFEYFILDNQGTVYLSTDFLQEGKNKASQDYFSKSQEQTFVKSFYYSLSMRKVGIIISTPIYDQGVLKGVLVGRLNLNKISDLMTERRGLGDSGETYLVNKFNILVSQSRFLKDVEYKKTIYSPIVKICLEHKEGSIEDIDYRGVLVFSYYKWSPELDVCIISKIDQNEAYSDVVKLRKIMILVASIFLFFILFFGGYISHSISSSIIKLKETASKIGKGQFNLKVKLKTKDEIGDLAKTIEEMAQNLKFTKEELATYTRGLESKVRERTKELSLSKDKYKRKAKEADRAKLATLNILEDVEEARAKLNESYHKLKGLEKLKTEFLSLVSHELRTPLSPIRSQLQRLLSQNLSKEKRQESLEMVLRNAIRLDRLINDVLDISRIESKRLKIFKKKSNFSNLIKEVVETMAPFAKDKSIQIITKLKLLPLFMFDEDRMKQVLINLIDNAIKHSQSKKIIISAEKKESQIIVCVKDEGKGVSAEELPHLFESFYFGKKSATAYKGAGLGLAICKGIVKSHGGNIHVTSKEGKGTTFCFDLNLKTEPKEKSKTKIEIKKSSRSKKEKKHQLKSSIYKNDKSSKAKSHSQKKKKLVKRINHKNKHKVIKNLRSN